MRGRQIVSMLNPFRAVAGEAREKERRADFEHVFSSARGRKVLAEIVNEGCVFRAHIRLDAHRLAVLEGRRSLALDIFDLAGGARARLGHALTRDDIGEALNEPNARPAVRVREPDPDTAAEPGADGEPLYAAAERAGPILADGDE